MISKERIKEIYEEELKNPAQVIKTQDLQDLCILALQSIELESKLAKAREALEFYANEKSWEESHCYCGSSTVRTIIEGVIHKSDIENESGGRRAREALKEIGT